MTLGFCIYLQCSYFINDFFLCGGVCFCKVSELIIYFYVVRNEIIQCSTDLLVGSFFLFQYLRQAFLLLHNLIESFIAFKKY